MGNGFVKVGEEREGRREGQWRWRDSESTNTESVHRSTFPSTWHDSFELALLPPDCDENVEESRGPLSLSRLSRLTDSPIPDAT